MKLMRIMLTSCRICSGGVSGVADSEHASRAYTFLDNTTFGVLFITVPGLLFIITGAARSIIVTSREQLGGSEKPGEC